MSTLSWVLFWYTVAVIVFCSWSWKCYKRGDSFLWKGFARDIAAVWLTGVCGVIGFFFDAIIESVKGIYKGSCWVVRKFKED